MTLTNSCGAGAGSSSSNPVDASGSICDVDGRIGGFNFQWAWASGFVAGRAIGERLARATETASGVADESR